MLWIGSDIRTLQQLMGHATVQMLMRCLNLADSEAIAVHKVNSPADRHHHTKQAGIRRLAMLTTRRKLARLQASLQPASPAAAALQAANQRLVERQAHEGAIASAQRSTAERRIELFAAAKQSLEGVLRALTDTVRESASSATISSSPNVLVRLGDATLIIDQLSTAPSDCLAVYDRPPAFDVIGYASIVVRRPRDQYGYEGRSHSLWFSDAHDEGVYRWFETAFMVQALLPETSSINPFALPPTDEKAAAAFTPVISARQVAWEPLPFDQGDEEQFIERWLMWLAEAANGTLRHPRSMPEASGSRHRSPSSRQ